MSPLPERDRDGYLVRLADWNPQVAEALAANEGIALTDEHWALIEMIRAFYRSYEVSPAMRVLVKHARECLGPERGTSIHLLQLFPGSPAKVLAKIAGLPRPTNCI